ncbi:PQQ-like beta-propeller repeat protein [Planotetraspora silvatica]|uniref:outer membrane protein assembly factor BamB family protein n=1 Tax=Planotetraspora silvatica TaxID=234614 RepID=UPI00194FCC22|nr:PQQ-like beta-propeller repeat protein [Planotetraspora silvatica]
MSGLTLGLGAAGLAWYVAGMRSSRSEPSPKSEFRPPSPAPAPTSAGWQRPIVVGPMCTMARSGDDLYLYDARGTVHALDAGTGATRWKAEPGVPVDTGILLSGDMVVVGGTPHPADGAIPAPNSPEGAVVALDRRTGEPVWRHGTVGSFRFIGGPLPGSVLVHDSDGVLRLLNAATGEVVWRSEVASDTFHLFSVARLAVSGPVVLETFVGTLRADMGDPVTHPNTDWFRALDGVDGTVRWTADVAAAKWTVVPHAGGGRPGTSGSINWLSTEVAGFVHVVRAILSPTGDPNFALSTTSELVGVDVGSGRSMWTFPAGLMSQPVVEADAIYVASAETPDDAVRIHGWDARTGRELWTFRPDGDDAKILIPGATSLAIDGEVLCAGSLDGIVAVDVRTGRKNWSVHHRAHGLRGAPVISGGVVYMVDDSGPADIRAWRLSDGRERPFDGPRGGGRTLVPAGDMLYVTSDTALYGIPLGE